MSENPFSSIYAINAPTPQFARDPIYTSNPNSNGSASPITPAAMGNAKPPSVNQAPQKNAFDAYSDERMAKDQNYQRELNSLRMRGARSGTGSAATDELESKYKQKYRDEWSKLSEDQRADYSNNYVKNGVIGKENSINTSRLANADFKGQTANERINGIAAGTGEHNFSNPAAIQKGQMAIQDMIADKEKNGVNPYTNEYVGVAPTKDVTNDVNKELGVENDQKVTATPYGSISSGKNPTPINQINSTNAATSGIAEMKDQQAGGGTPIAQMIAAKQEDQLAGKNPADRYAGPAVPTTPTADQETEEMKRKRQQASNQPPAPVQAQQATPQAVSSDT